MIDRAITETNVCGTRMELLKAATDTDAAIKEEVVADAATTVRALRRREHEYKLGHHRRRDHEPSDQYDNYWPSEG